MGDRLPLSLVCCVYRSVHVFYAHFLCVQKEINLRACGGSDIRGANGGIDRWCVCFSTIFLHWHTCFFLSLYLRTDRCAREGQKEWGRNEVRNANKRRIEKGTEKATVSALSRLHVFKVI